MIEHIQQDLKTIFAGDPRRLKHIHGVFETAMALAKHYGADGHACAVAALLHDITKNAPHAWQLEQLKAHGDEVLAQRYTAPFYHGFTAAYVAQETYHIDNEDILNAIRYHTVGRPAMSLCEKIIFVADYCEPHRPHATAKTVHALAFNDLDEAVYAALSFATDYHQSQGDLVPEVALETLAHYKGVLDEKT